MKRNIVLGALVATLAAVLALGCDSGSGSDDEGTDVAAVEEDGTAGEDAEPAEEVTPETTPVEEDVATQDTAPAVDDVPPEVTMGFVPYSAFEAGDVIDVSWTDNGTVFSVELLVDGAVAGAVMPDADIVVSSSIEAGVHEVAVRVKDAAGNVTETEPVPAIFAGKGKFLPFTDGWKQGQIPGWGGFLKKVPDGATSIYDDKAHVTVPDGMNVAMAWLRWKSKTSWDMGFDIGTGNCPDSGQKLAGADQVGKAGLIEVTHSKEGQTLPTGKWFAHMRYKDGGAHPGEDQQFDALFLVLP